MARRTPPLKVKQRAALIREQRIYNRERRDDGVERRTEREPIASLDVRAISRKRKFHVPVFTLYKRELFVRKRMSVETAEAREVMIPLMQVLRG